MRSDLRAIRRSESRITRRAHVAKLSRRASTSRQLRVKASTKLLALQSALPAPGVAPGVVRSVIDHPLSASLRCGGQ